MLIWFSQIKPQVYIIYKLEIGKYELINFLSILSKKLPTYKNSSFISFMYRLSEEKKDTGKL